MKNISLLILGLAFLLLGCQDEDWNPAPDLNDFVGAVTLVTVSENPDELLFNALNDLDGESVSFDLDYDNFGTTEVTSISVSLSFVETGGRFDPFRGEFVDTTYSSMIIQDVPVASLPISLSYTAPQILAELAKVNPKFTSTDSLEVGDAFTLTFPVNLPDGTTLTTALNSDLCNEAAQPSAGGCAFSWGVSCPSSVQPGMWSTNVPDGAGGTYVIEITDTGGGSYGITNFNLDFQPSFYLTFTGLPIGGGFTDVCNTITLGRSAEFGVFWSATGVFDPVAETITFAEISDPAYGQGPWNNGGNGYVLTKL